MRTSSPSTGQGGLRFVDAIAAVRVDDVAAAVPSAQ